ncbi:DUF2255 family protein [Chondrinema litorale]|uniref:DUF2255 family protein n=1 Tax=Chondrinema litorale TaxID=2994555 RepID=UPI0025439C87|nr:DUF2255 family protein [Chondrinema litorale]UZR96450.1 DUF2255 family protein [Chondrinema litorale]
METISESLTQEEITLIAQKDDFHIAPFREDGKTYGTPTWIWVVSVENQLYVRAYNGTKSRWYNSAVKQKAGKIEAAGLTKKVRFELIEGDINDKIDEAYRQKYSKSPYLNSMISRNAKAATVKVLAYNE